MYPDNNSNSKKLYDRASKVLPGGNSRQAIYYPPYPIYAHSGKGSTVKDVEGVERLDFVNCNSASILGHGNPQVIKAVQAQAERLMTTGMPTEGEIQLSEIIVDRLPAVEKVRFCNSGSEALMFAARAARAYTGKIKIACLEGAYHGSYDHFETSLSPMPDNWGPNEAPATVPATEGLSPSVLEEVIVLPANDVEATRALLEKHADELACVVIDPLVSRMGFLPLSQSYLKMIREVTKNNNMALIFDEVFSFRLGYNGAQGIFGISPDLTTLGKVIGGGLPVGAIAGNSDVMSVFDHAQGKARVELSGTFSGNPMSMAAGIATMEQLTPEAFVHLNHIGERARVGIRKAIEKTGIKAIVNGMGSLMSVLFIENNYNNYREFGINMMTCGALDTGKAFHRYLLNHGVLCIEPGGFIFSTANTEEEIDQLIEASAGFFESLSSNNC